MLAELAAAVREGRVDPVDLVDESLRRIEASNPTLNAVTALRAEEALADAKASPRTGALAGLPLLVKDMARCAGMRTTFGSPLYADAEPDTVDDVVVARLQGRRCDRRRAEQHAGLRAHRRHDQPGVRRHPQPVEPASARRAGRAAAARRR